MVTYPLLSMRGSWPPLQKLLPSLPQFLPLLLPLGRDMAVDRSLVLQRSMRFPFDVSRSLQPNAFPWAKLLY